MCLFLAISLKTSCKSERSSFLQSLSLFFRFKFCHRRERHGGGLNVLEHGFLFRCVGRGDLWNGWVTHVLPSWLTTSCHNESVDLWLSKRCPGYEVKFFVVYLLYPAVCWSLPCYDVSESPCHMLDSCSLTFQSSALWANFIFVNCLVASPVLKQRQTDWGSDNRVPDPWLPTAICFCLYKNWKLSPASLSPLFLSWGWVDMKCCWCFFLTYQFLKNNVCFYI